MPLDVASAIVSFIGLSGQVLQGCNYLCDFFADTMDAPAIIKNISDHLEVIQPALSNIRATFLDLQALSYPPPILQDPTPALENCESAIAELKAFVDRHGSIRMSASATLQTITTSAGTISGGSPSPQAIPSSAASFPGTSKLRRGWQRLDIARKANKLRDLASRLEQAKSSVQLFQANLGLALARYQTTAAQEIKLFQEQLRDAQSTSRQISAETKDIALALRADMHMDLNHIDFESQTHSAHLTTLTQYASETRESSSATADAMGSLSRDFASKVDGLPAVIAPMVEIAVARALAQHTASEKKASARPWKSSHQEVLHVEHEAMLARTDSAGQGKSNIIHVPPITQSCVVSQTHSHGSGYKESQFASFSLKRGPKRQQTSTSSINVWFGRIQITTMVTDQEDRTGTDSLDPLNLQAKVTHITVIPNLRLLKMGVRIQFGDKNPSICHPLWDNRLRVFRIHQKDSPLAQAIRNTDYLLIRRMLRDREFTPHDIVDGSLLFEYVIWYLAYLQDSECSVKQLIMIAELLISSGSDCGADRSLYNACDMLKFEGFSESPVQRLIRMIILHSESDPFNRMDSCFITYWYSTSMEKVLPLFLAQEEWDLSEFQQSFAKVWGKDSWQYLAIKRGDRLEWDRQQKERLSQLPICLRQDREYCIGEFGEHFVIYKWRTHYWCDQRPHFWRSPEAYRELFGDHFMEYYWGSLCWEIEAPTFWHSWKACQNLFGKFLIAHHWPPLLQERSFDHVEGQGAWQYFLKLEYGWEWWAREGRKSWVQSMVDKWKSEDEDLRHSRQHCIEIYGTSFVRDELPRLLRDFDGLPEDEINELTQEGQDLVPPSPKVRLLYRDNRDLWTQLDGELDWQTKEDSQGVERESQEAEEDVWETADEG